MWKSCRRRKSEPRLQTEQVEVCGGAAHLSVLLHHDVGVVSVTNSQNERRHTVTCTRPGEQVDGSVIPEGQTGAETDRYRQTGIQTDR